MKKIDLGEFGLNVKNNVRMFRGDTSYAELSRRLTNLGRPIPPLGLRHLEAGGRRVDVDDLVALAEALGASPMTLLLPHHSTDPMAVSEASILLTTGIRGGAQRAIAAGKLIEGKVPTDSDN